MKKIEIGQTVKAWCQKTRGYIIGRVEEIDERGNPVVRPSAYEGGTKFFMEFLVSERILTVVAARDCVVLA